MVTVTIYAKMMLPDESFIETNQVTCNIFIKYESGQKSFSKKIVLGGVSSIYLFQIVNLLLNNLIIQ